METVKISFYISIVSLIVNVGINYVLIFGRFGAPELGIRGAAIGTLVARIVELGIVVVYMLKIDKKLKLFSENFMKFDAALRKDYALSLIHISTQKRTKWPMIFQCTFMRK